MARIQLWRYLNGVHRIPILCLILVPIIDAHADADADADDLSRAQKRAEKCQW